MPILLILGLFFPRFIIFVLWWLTEWFVRVPIDWIMGFLGFLFMPYTLLWFSVVSNIYSGAWGPWQTLIMVVAVLTDFFHLFGSGRAYYSE